MVEKLLKTSADDLYELVRSRKKIPVEEAAKILRVPTKIMQALVDFLVEEGVFGIEYKITTPYVYISQKKKKIDLSGNVEKPLVTKEEFFQKASKWNIPFEKINELWKKYVKENINSIKNVFYIKAKSRNLPKEKIDILWNKYLVYLQ